MFPVPWSSKWSWSLHLFLGRPIRCVNTLINWNTSCMAARGLQNLTASTWNYVLHETGFSSEVFCFRVKTSSSSSHSEMQFGMTVGPHLSRSSYIFIVGWWDHVRPRKGTECKFMQTRVVRHEWPCRLSLLCVKFNLMFQIYEAINRIKVMWSATALLKWTGCG